VKKLISVSLVALIALSLIFSACSGSSKTPTTPTTTYIIATDATWAPFEYVNDQNQIVGFDIDLMNAIAQSAGIKIQFQNVPFDPLLAGMAQGTYDAAISSITITDERSKSMLFSDPYYVAGQMIVVQKNNASITVEDSLKGKKLGAQLGTTGESLADGITGATVKSYDQIGLAIQDLLNGQLDAVICDTPIANSYVGKNASTLKIVGNALTTENYGIAVAKGKNDLLNKINQGLAAVKAKGTIDTLVTKWLTS
jgi:polar amino acid transport system substrate-binding protein